jgi:hypothetical protein
MPLGGDGASCSPEVPVMTETIRGKGMEREDLTGRTSHARRVPGRPRDTANSWRDNTINMMSIIEGEEERGEEFRKE